METRVDKYKDYRTKLISDGDKVFDNSRRFKSESFKTV